VFKVEHNLTDPAEYLYDKQYENKLNKVQIGKCAEESNDLSMMKIIESDCFIERAVYHNGCVTNYLLKLKPAKTSKNNDELLKGRYLARH
jgi:hypothetical protein